MRVLVAGAVAWTDRKTIHRELHNLPTESVILHGDSPGADALAGEIARELGLTVVPMKKEQQDYAKYQRAAWKGLNERMLNAEVVLVLAFHPQIAKSRGTKHLVELAAARGIAVRVVAK